MTSIITSTNFKVSRQELNGVPYFGVAPIQSGVWDLRLPYVWLDDLSSVLTVSDAADVPSRSSGDYVEVRRTEGSTFPLSGIGYLDGVGSLLDVPSTFVPELISLLSTFSAAWDTLEPIDVDGSSQPLSSFATVLDEVSGGFGSIPAATNTVRGAIKLAGDLSGTSDAPTVPGLAGKVDSSTVAELIRDVIGATLVAGTNISINVNDAGDIITISASGGGGGGGVWGAITGLLSDQLDLQSALNAKISAFADPNADRIVFWDDSAGAFAALSTGTGLSLSGTTLSVAAASETVSGRAELATAAETVAGTDNTRAVHPAGLAAIRGLLVGINAQVGTSYTPVLADQGKLVTLDNVSPITITLPQDSDVALPVGAQILFASINTGLATFVNGTGATVVGTPTLIARARYSVIGAVKILPNIWLLTGDLAS